MKTPEEVNEILTLYSMGWGIKTIARELGIDRQTVRKYVRKQEWTPYEQSRSASILGGLEEWLRQQFFLHGGNAEVVRQELLRVHQCKVSLRTVERAVAPYRQQMRAEAKATVRFETPPGKQLQIDFGSKKIQIAEVFERVYLFVATLGFSRRLFVHPFRHERQTTWFKGLEGAFHHFGGIPQDVLLDNPRALVKSHNAMTREVVFNERFRAFASYWGFRPVACAPYRARTKGKDERGVGYVKHNAIAGRAFSSWAALESHLQTWMIDYADQRLHGTTKEKPVERFRAEAGELKALDGRPPFFQMRELLRVVHSDACIEVGTNRYSVPWRFIGQRVTVQLLAHQLQIFYGKEKIAEHKEVMGHRMHSILPNHLEGIVGAPQPQTSTLLRPLSEYATVVGGVR